MINRLAGLLLALILAPLMAGVAVLIRLREGRPVLFCHERAGLGGRPFRLLKFRTMRPPVAGRAGGAEAGGGADGADDDRITPLGRFLRRTSLDELPELWNVVRGEMNLVGPRPLPVAYNARYSPAQARRLEVKPGLTGPVQVYGRNALSWEAKFALDTAYVENHGWRGDVKLLLRTPLAVLQARGISHPGHATMPVFMGSDPAAGAGAPAPLEE